MGTELEIWKGIDNYIGLYQVSNLGNVKSMYSKKILKPSLKSTGYYSVCLVKDKTKKTIAIHRLVAEAFIPNPDNLPQVNHKDENKTNNKVENLEWCSRSYNCSYGIRNKKIIEKNNKKIRQYDLKDNFIKEWDSIKQAQEQLKIRNISQATRGIRKSAGGYLWKRSKA